MCYKCFLLCGTYSWHQRGIELLRGDVFPGQFAQKINLHLKMLQTTESLLKKSGENLHQTDFHVGPGSRFSVQMTSHLKALLHVFADRSENLSLVFITCW